MTSPHPHAVIRNTVATSTTPDLTSTHRESFEIVANMGAAAQRVHASYQISARSIVAPYFMQSAPITTMLQGEIKPGWVITRSLLLTMELDQYGDFVISDDKFDVYGVGQTRARALADYIDSLIEYYELLAAGATKNRFDAAAFSYLKQYVLRVSA